MDWYRNVAAATAFAAEKLCKTNLFETERMFCDVYGLQPGQEQKVHSHAGSDKLYYVLSGTGLFTVGTDQQSLGAGHAIFAAAGLPHAVANPGPEPLSLLIFMAPKP